MKIAFIVGKFPTISETFILNQITGLLDKGHDITIFAKYFSGNSKVHGDVIKYELLNKVNYFINFPENKFRRILNGIYLFIRGIFKNPIITLNSINIFKYKQDASSLKLLYLVTPFLGKRFDILQCHFGNIGIIGAKLKQLGVQGKLVTMFHGNDIRAGLKKGPGIYKGLADKGDCFLATSNYCYNSFLKFGFNSEKIIRHTVGIDLSKFPFQPKYNYNRFKDIIIILTVTRLIKGKGISYGIKAINEVLKRNPKINLEYHIVGSGNLENNLKELIRKLDLQKTVKLFGEVTQEEVINKLRKSHIFLLPSLEEALGVVLLEAQAVGIPVIATSVGSVSQALLDGKSGFIVPEKNVNALAERIEYLINNPDVWTKMGLAGRNFIEDRYDITKLNKKLEKIYEDLLNN
ncbi:D-inositol-3-phosphate glycosyltransferase [subsurface metagenome]